MRQTPVALPILKTSFYGKSDIPVDIYRSATLPAHASPIMLYIHGGGWIGGTRSEYSRPIFENFLLLGFLIISINYHLLPETNIHGQLHDIRQVEGFLRIELPNAYPKVDGNRVIVCGASAGAHLAMLTPSLWAKPPNGILSICGPTNMHSVDFLRKGRFADYQFPQLTSADLKATMFEPPPTEILPATRDEDLYNPRSLLAKEFICGSLIAEFLLQGFCKDSCGNLRLPKKGSVSSKAIDKISPIHLVDKNYPPVCQVRAEDDDVFDNSHTDYLHEVLNRFEISSKVISVPGVGHSFEIYEAIGSEIAKDFLYPAVDWIARFVL